MYLYIRSVLISKWCGSSSILLLPEPVVLVISSPLPSLTILLLEAWLHLTHPRGSLFPYVIVTCRLEEATQASIMKKVYHIIQFFDFRNTIQTTISTLKKGIDTINKISNNV